MGETDREELGKQLDREADELEERSEELHGGVEEARHEWEQKRADPGVPGANPREEGDEEDEETQGSADEEEEESGGTSD